MLFNDEYTVLLYSFCCLWKVPDVYSKEVPMKTYEDFLRTYMVYDLTAM